MVIACDKVLRPSTSDTYPPISLILHRSGNQFLKERKRLSSSSVERISVKKVRLMGGASTSSSSADVASTSSTN
ncbi:AGAP010629-PA-like protein [Anopheles sinensis]|uniref:AGAP010629-PA-like protein n=1 Tax=Anopheles sinensis TaxID=74873 RepID=A0A084WLR7_ANOSI|nr:AGAP010629-PA-like protein [Anopheles sinensis]